MYPVGWGGWGRAWGHVLTILILGKVFQGSTNSHSNIGRGRSLRWADQSLILKCWCVWMCYNSFIFHHMKDYHMLISHYHYLWLCNQLNYYYVYYVIWFPFILCTLLFLYVSVVLPFSFILTCFYHCRHFIIEPLHTLVYCTPLPWVALHLHIPCWLTHRRDCMVL